MEKEPVKAFLSELSRILAVLCALSAPALATDWATWLGPNRDGKSMETGLLKSWPAGDLVLNSKIDPGNVFDLALPLDRVAEGYRAMDERRAIKARLRP